MGALSGEKGEDGRAYEGRGGRHDSVPRRGMRAGRAEEGLCCDCLPCSVCECAWGVGGLPSARADVRGRGGARELP